MIETPSVSGHRLAHRGMFTHDLYAHYALIPSEKNSRKRKKKPHFVEVAHSAGAAPT